MAKASRGTEACAYRISLVVSWQQTNRGSSRMRILTAAVIVCLSIGVAAGCSSDKKQSTAKILEQLTLAVSFDAKVEQDVKLDCPREVTAKKGASFDCTFQGKSMGFESEGGAPMGTAVSGSVTATLENDDGSNFSYQGEDEGAGGKQQTFKGVNGKFVSNG